MNSMFKWLDALGFQPYASATATLVGIAASGCFIAYQVRKNRAIAKANIINELDKDMYKYNAVAYKIRLDPHWPQQGQEAGANAEELANLLAYINFFEKIKAMLDNGVVDIKDIDSLYAFKFFTLTGSPQIAKLQLAKEEFAPYYASLYALHQQWYFYRQKQRLPIPRADTQFLKYT